MIRLAEIIKTFLPDLEQKYGSRLLPSHRQALTAIEQCRTQALGTAAIHCHDCDSHEVFPLSCGHRFCPQCQHEAAETWLERQRAKLLPVDYYLITFTLPATLRALVYDHQREAYDLLIRLAWQTLAAFGLRDKALHGDLGATVVLHTHSRALDFHPHVHVVLPAGAIDPATRHWNRKTGKFLFPHKALAKVFRAKWFAAMKEFGWAVQADLPPQCRRRRESGAKQPTEKWTAGEPLGLEWAWRKGPAAPVARGDWRRSRVRGTGANQVSMWSRMR